MTIQSARQLLLKEHDVARGVTLSAVEAEALARAGARLRLRPEAGGTWSVGTAHVVGTFALPTLRVVIEPKIPIRRLLYLLCFGMRSIAWLQTVRAEGASDLLSFMQHLYAEALERALRGGLVHEYRERYGPVTVVRGAVDHYGLVARRFGVFPPVDCRYQDFTADTEPNRRLLAAAIILTRSTERDASATARLGSFIERMSEVENVEPEKGLPALRLDRRYARYGAAPTLADLILRFSSVELRAGTTASLGFLADMNLAFEDFVIEGLREALGPRASRWRRKPTVHLDVEATVELKPDLIWWSRGGRPALVLDAKYKVSDDGENVDLYQMVAYCRALGAPIGVLVYASAKERTITVPNGGPLIHVLRCEPDGEPGELRHRLSALASALTRLVDESTAATATGF